MDIVFCTDSCMCTGFVLFRRLTHCCENVIDRTIFRNRRQ